MVVMKKREIAVAEPRSLAKGLIAGCLGGVAGILAMTFAERLFPPQAREKPPAEPNGESAAANALAETAPEAAGGIRWGFGVAAGAAYGAVVEYFPAATAKDGASFGVALGALTQQTAPHAVGVSAGRQAANEITPFVAYGVTTEFVRKLVRKLL